MYFDQYINVHQSSQGGEGVSALDHLVADAQPQNIITFCRELDNMLGGGIPLQRITEFCGAPGVGKTQLAFQLAVNCCIPKILYGVEGKCIFIDTEGGFYVDRVKQMADSLIEHLQIMGQTGTDQEKDAANQITVDSILENIMYYKIHHYIEQVAFIHHLPLVLENDRNIKLIIIDSIAYPFRRHFSDMGARKRILSSMTQNLLSIAEQYNVAVVIMNQVTTKILPNNQSMLVPCFNLGNYCANRVFLYWKDQQRHCHIYKSSLIQPSDAPFDINQDGVRGFIPDGEEADDNDNNGDGDGGVGEEDVMNDQDHPIILPIQYYSNQMDTT
ncbi:putative DNA repair protein [Cavenderia fasciculata]|uniref:DNA repair protein RAD51 homolog 3 n=1 Tax=Cavenderia fasciculata TaxID=261658 RepID=F4PW19_CACFS|nr:putative DNA repair protein [Cavenderia fasciculata]EGG20183.1 putative DNA repair protein [Cavenderia fasciculata]|eukprot:XP_004367166.1 putative DNA repair protein [Cavenderia fasciculata]